MKNVLLLLFALLLSTSSPQAAATPMPLSDADFVIKDDNNCIDLFGTYEVSADAVTISPVSERRAYEVHVYEDFILGVISGDDFVFSITLTTPAFETARGIRVGDDISDVFDRYGSTKKQMGSPFLYSYNGMFISFYTDALGQITKIEIEML